METVKKISDLDPQDLPTVERVFGQRLDKSGSAELILRLAETAAPPRPANDGANVPEWCNVLEGLGDEDLAEFNAGLATPVRVTHRS